ADTSPNIDKLSETGVQFDAWFSTSSWTRPGMATIVTGQFPGEVGVYEEKFDKLPPKATTLSERLQEHGYLTLGVNSNPNLNNIFGFNQGFDAYRESGVVWSWMHQKYGGKAFSFTENNADSATEITNLALEALDQHKTTSKPFYLQIVYFDPHGPYAPPKEHRRAIKKDSRFDDYDGEIRFVDHEIGRLYSRLEERKLLDDTLIIITSDHGEGLDDHPGVPESTKHGTHVYDSNIHVPLIFNHPTLTPGRRISQISSSVNLVPTVMDLLGWPVAKKELSSDSVAPLVQNNGSANLPAYIYAETDFRKYRKFAVRSATQKYIRNDDSAFFQLDGAHEGKTLTEQEERALKQVPPQELYVLDGSPEHPGNNLLPDQSEALKTLQAAMKQWEEQVPRIPPLDRYRKDVFVTGDGTVKRDIHASETDMVLDEETLLRLQALGYMNDEE
ncbi:MAG: sulfatase, partial [Proteobacteria bacterium]|nr:sulfatase [Pseudomonadota bacterium]